MKKHLCILLFIMLSPVMLTAQTTNEITSEGRAKIKVKPDLVTIKIDVRKRNESEALKALNLEMDGVQKLLTQKGIPAKQIKIADFSVNSNDRFSSRDDKKFYTALSSLSIEIKLDNKLLDALYGEIQSGKYQDVNINYVTVLSDELQKKTTAMLTEATIADARQNAENIAKALGVKLGAVKKVSKNGTETVSYRNGDYAVYASSYETVPQTVFTKFEITDKVLEDQIVIVFEIGK